ncbi:SpaA isopeptide-forming pilin-related protein [Paenilisteria rocourtiae]|uniref:LPXTG-motif cell wall-anchored protein n=1 Tax=Listeria rocourtiae TaxID=647910 RepID=A0A4V3DPQ0_9LIST|nr:SpaA isopeptide-forming pilin-related protein [Listeria rocourtiae]MBC1604778.1 LPXTG cell wall anchor domain-containing protein [Listeria rocourtiae]TDR53136.1 LPXTG-motif cell wall-anchored protein [Listeria rocourtiae]
MKRLISMLLVLAICGSVMLPGVAGQASVDAGNFDIDLEVYDDPIISNGQVNMKVTLSADANTIVDENGLVKVIIPREIFSSGDLSNIHSDAFTFDHVENPASDDPNSIAVYVKPDASYNEGGAWSASFQLSFQAPLLRPGTEISPEQTFEVTYNGKSDSQTLRVEASEGGKPTPFEKWWKSAVDSNGIGILDERDSRYNIFHLAVNAYGDFELGDVTVTDQIPDGLSVEQTPVTTPNIEASDFAAVKGIRIVKIAADGSRKYVTSQYRDAILFDEATQRLEVNFKNLTKTDCLLIEYRVNMDTNKEIYKNTATMQSTNVEDISASVLVRPDSNTNFNKVLTKSVDKKLLIGDDNTLIYTLTLRSITGTIKAGQVFTDTLDNRLQYRNMLAGTDLFDVTLAGQTMIFTAKKDIALGEKGEVTFKVDAKNLPVGETVTNKSEIKLDDKQYDSNTVTTKRVSNGLLIRKVDQEDSSKFLAGATFKVLNKAGDAIREGITNEAGELLFKDIEPGEYTVVETVAPEGYVLDTTPKRISIEANNSEITELLFKNTRNDVGSIQVEKIDAETKEKLAGAKFTLTSNQGTKSGKTNSDGELRFENLTPGHYTLEEVASPEGYVLEKVKKDIEVISGETEAIKVIVENSRSKGSVVLTKRDSETKEALPSVAFQLFDDKGKIIKDRLITDENGQIKVENLAWGKYFFKEVKALEGYVLDEKEVAFEINRSNANQTIELTKLNERLELNQPEKPNKQPELPVTGDQTSPWVLLFGTIVSALGVRIYMKSRK